MKDQKKPLCVKLASTLSIAAALLASGCGYTLSHSAHALRDNGVTKIYIAPIQNKTYKAGAEVQVFNQLIKTFRGFGSVEIVSKRELADGELSGELVTAEYSRSGETTADLLQPKGTGDSKIKVATTYQATLSCSFQLRRIQAPGETIVNGTATKSKVFAANNQLGTLGTTSALINESEFDRALGDLAESVSDQIHETVTGGF